MTSRDSRDNDERRQWAFVVILLVIILMLIVVASVTGKALTPDEINYGFMKSLPWYGTSY